MIGVELAKNVFLLHRATVTGVVRFRKKLTRPQYLKFMTEHPAAVVVMSGRTLIGAPRLTQPNSAAKMPDRWARKRRQERHGR